MRPVFNRNIDTQGRVLRGLGAVALLGGAVFGFFLATWLGFVLLAASAFVAFEAARGWCALRACGIKTRL